MRRYQAPTPGTRIAVWLFPPVTAWLGYGYLTAQPSQLGSPAFDAAAQIPPFSWFAVPMHAWGTLFLLVAALKVALLLWGGREARGFVLAMCAGMALYALWGFLILASVVADMQSAAPTVTLGAPALPIGWAAMHAAVLATLTGRGPGGGRLAGR